MLNWKSLPDETENKTVTGETLKRTEIMEAGLPFGLIRTSVTSFVQSTGVATPLTTNITFNNLVLGTNFKDTAAAQEAACKWAIGCTLKSYDQLYDQTEDDKSFNERVEDLYAAYAKNLEKSGIIDASNVVINESSDGSSEQISTESAEESATS